MMMMSSLMQSAEEAVANETDNLILFATDGKINEIQTYLSKNQDLVNEQDSNGYSALMAAASYIQIDTLKFLLAHPQIDLKLVDVEGDSALHYCVEPKCAKLLIDAGADKSLTNAEGLTPRAKVLQEIEEMEEEQADDDDENNDELGDLKKLYEYFVTLD